MTNPDLALTQIGKLVQRFKSLPGAQRRIQQVDGEIDRIVYQFYGLTEEEIRIVEGR